MDLYALLPSDLAVVSAGGLVALSFFTSALTAAVGIGGGVVLLAVMASFLPPLVVLPVHGIVQLGSNSGRAAVMRAHIHWRIAGYFFLGSIVGVVLAAKVFIALPVGVLQALLGLFVLYAVWAPKLRPSSIPLAGFVPVGALTSFATLFVGGTGPLVSAFFSPAHLGREKLVAPHATCMTIQHGLKGIAFGFLGFQFLPWLPVMVAMIASGFIGTLAGCRILQQLPERLFIKLFRLVLPVLGLRLLLLGLIG